MNKKNAGIVSIYELSINNSYIHIVPDYGCIISQLVLDGKEILVPLPTIKNITNTQYINKLLIPFPNRIAKGTYAFHNKQYQLEQNEISTGHALHGLLFNKKFHFVDKIISNKYVQIIFDYQIEKEEFSGYPFSLYVKASFTLKEKELKIDILARNTDSCPIPYGVGWHPYFKATNSTINKDRISISSNTILELSKENSMIPTGNTIAYNRKNEYIDKESFDTCFTHLFQKETHFNGFTLFQDKTMNYLQIYTPPDRQSIAIEPMSCAPDAFNNGLGLVTLMPNKSINNYFGIRVI